MTFQLDNPCVPGRWFQPAIIFAVGFLPSVGARAGDQVAATIDLPRWKPREFAFVADTEIDKPFQVAFSATLGEPNGVEWQLPGYYDGKRTWKLRIAPPTEGNWSIATHASHSSLDKRTTSFVCVKNADAKVRGALRVDPQHPHTFIYEDGLRYFALGYECDWLWALDHGAVDPKTLHSFLDTLAAHGFN